MKSTDLRAKARAIFGSAIAEPMPKQPNGAKALQQRANARPIPTYKVGGVVKKPTVPTPRGSPEADDVLITTRRGQQILEEQRRRDAQRDRAADAKRKAADKLLGIPAQKNGGKAGCYKDGGKVQTSSDTARKLAKEMGGMKKGGKAKDGLAVMIAIGEAKKPAKKALGGGMDAKLSRAITNAKADMARMAATPRVDPRNIKEIPGGGMFGKMMSSPKFNTDAQAAPAPRERVMNPKARAMVEAAADKGARGAPRTAIGRPLTMPAPEPKVQYKDGGSPVKKAVGGAGKTRKGQAPIKKAQGGAAKVRKGMMTPEGKILDAIGKARGK